MKKALFLLLLLPAIAFSQTTIVTWNTTNTSNQTGITPATVASGQYLSASSIAAQNVNYVANQYNGFQTSNWPTAANFDNSKYVYFSISSLSNNTVTVSSVAFAYSGTAKKQRVQYILDGAALASEETNTTDAQAEDWASKSYSKSLNITIPAGKTLVVRISAAQGNSRQIGNITVNGSTTVPSAYAGVYRVGASSGFPFNTLSNAANAISSYGVNGPVTLLLDNTSYSVATGETFPITFGAINGTSAANTVTIKPAPGVNTKIEAANIYVNNSLVPVSSVVLFKGADYVTFDGSNVSNGTTNNLTVSNLNDVNDDSSRSAFWIASDNNNGATNITIKNLTVKNGSKNAGGVFNAAVYSGNYGLGGNQGKHIAIAQATANNSNLTVTNNVFQNVKEGVYVNGGTGSSVATNITVSKNDMGTQNNGEYLVSALTFNNVNTFTASNNNIYNIYRDNNNGDALVVAEGIYVLGASKNGSITKNKLKDIIKTTGNSQVFAGILLASTEAASNITVDNNFVQNVANAGGGDANQNGHGIAIVNGGGYKVYFNTVVLGTNQPYGGFSAALYVGANAGNALDVRNNIFANNQTTGRRTAITIVKHVSQLNNIFTSLDYNNYSSVDRVAYVANANGTGNVNWAGNGQQGSSQDNADYFYTVNAWKNVTGKDAHTLDVTPSFVSATDLHLTENNAGLDNKGVAITGFNKDIDGDLRGANPDMGADEFGADNMPAPGDNTGIYCDGATTWNGTEWSNGEPNASKDAIFNANYTQTGGNLAACSVYVLNGATVNFISNSTATVTHSVNVDAQGSLTFESGSVLMQIEGDANKGIVTIKRNSGKLKRLDYTIWSSPVTGNQTLRRFSMGTSNGRFYTYITATSLFRALDEITAKFDLAKGYLIRMPNSNSTPGYNEGNTRIQVSGEFRGTPNNGTVKLPMEYADAQHAFNITGNPYPSPISVRKFINANIDNIDGTVWLWRKNNNATQTSYCTVNLAGYVANAAPGGHSEDGNDLIADPYAIDPNGSLNTAQGFFVKAAGAGKELVFKNDMRIVNHSQTFFRSANPESVDADQNRVWLNVTNAAGDFDQSLIAYSAITTTGFDKGYDGTSLGAGNISLYSVMQVQNDTLKLSIQSRGDFNVTDKVKMGFSAAAAGTYTISIDHMDGLFADGQKVYIQDNAEGITRELTRNSYTFQSEAGTFEERFTVIYTTESSLGTEPVKAEVKDVIVYKNNNQISMTAPQQISSVVVYDMLGRSLYQNSKVDNVEFTTGNINVAQQVVIVLVTLENKQVVTKKIMMN